MKKILFLLATAALLALGTSASAQRRSSRPAPSLTAGFITLSPTYCHSDGSTNDNFLTLAAGVRQLIPIQASTSLNLAYGADLEWMMYTGNNSREYLSYNQNLIGVKVPFSLVYKYDLNDEISFFPYVGLHVSGYLYGRASASAGGYSSSVNVFSEDDMWTGAYKRFLLGAQVGAKACYENIFFGIGYERSLTALMPDTVVGRINFAVGFAF